MDMLVKRKAERDKTKYLKYTELKEYVRLKSIKTKQDYINHLFSFQEKDGKIIPYNPSTFYNKETWEGWSLFLRDEIYKKNYNGTYYSYNECKEVIKKYEFTGKSNFIKRIKDIIKLDIRIPYSPSTIYKKEWEGWIEFLNTDNCVEQIENLVEFEVAREYARSLNFKLQKQWYSIKFSELPEGMTKKPENHYKEKGWVDWYDFLGIDKKSAMSYGELLISNFLDRFSISYRYNKSLKDCISVSKLRFDFYLPDYNMCIEFDGRQHFEARDYYGGEEEFEKLKIRDSIKNEWCKVNNVNLIRFNYKNKKDEIENQLISILNLSHGI